LALVTTFTVNNTTIENVADFKEDGFAMMMMTS